MNTYELMVIIDASPEAEKIDRAVKTIEELITGKKGKILSNDNWGRRRLAYEIQRRQYGYYSLFTFEIDPKEVIELNRMLRLNPMVLRHLMLLLNPKILEQVAIRPKPSILDEEVDEVIGLVRQVGLEPIVLEPIDEELLKPKELLFEGSSGEVSETPDAIAPEEKRDLSGEPD
jgi:small subunit ribosomal protein S6